ncbi:MAG: tyrosine-type recombinase/integrase [Patescibacteria group bacterium]|nr:tyrosine-type recombinase/integrase [Patescibacteria group bacterium]
MAALKTHIQDFLDHLEIEKNRSPRTLDNYKHYLERFVDFAKGSAMPNITPGQISLPLVKKYRLYLNRYQDSHTGAGLKLSTQNYHLIALRAFLKYLSKNDIKTLAAEKIELPKMPSRTVDFLEMDELDRIFNAIPKDNQLQSLRDYAILSTLFSTGLRVSELAGLTKGKINLNRGEFMVRGKGNKPRIVFLSPEAKSALQRYLAKRKDNDDYVFVSHGSNQGEAGLTPRSVQRIIQKYATKAGIVKKVTPHTLRHSYATDLLINGADIRSVQAMLGHSSITTTQVYTHITNRQLKDVHRAFHSKRK